MKSVNLNTDEPLSIWTEPDDGGKTVLGAIESAKYSVDISIYELGGPKILDSLLVAKKNGVRIRIMFNAQFFIGNDPSNDKYSQQYAIKKALEEGEGTYIPELHWSCNNFNITHQKTIIIDARTDIGNDTLPDTAKALVMTLNLSAYGWNMPGATCTSPCQFWGPGYPDKSPGTRDFGVVLTEADKVSKIQTIFDSDFGCSPANITNGLRDSDDGLIWSNGTTGITPAKKGYYPKDGDYPYYDYEKLKEAEDQGNARKAHLYVIQQAQHTLLIYNEEMNDIELVDAIADAAKKGVDVKVLMTYNVKYGKNFDKIVDAGGEVRLFPDSNSWLYIHAKVLLADYGHTTAVSFMGSQNISGNSLNFNRELGVILTGDPDNKLFYDTFFKDWEVKGLTTWEVYNENDSDEVSYKYNNGERATRKYASPKSKTSQDETVYIPMTCGPLQDPTSVKKRGLINKSQLTKYTQCLEKRTNLKN